MRLSKTITFILLFSFIATHLAAKPKTSRYEFFWSVFHPIAAIKVKRTYKKANALYNEGELAKVLDSYSQGGKLDAFRHTFFMAAFSQKVPSKKLIKLGRAHEKTNYLQYKRDKQRTTLVPDSMSCVMDLMNNEVGIKLGKEMKSASLEDLKLKVIELINQDKVFRLLIDANGKFLDCNNNVVEVETYKNKWFVPKCMIGLSAMQINDSSN